MSEDINNDSWRLAPPPDRLWHATDPLSAMAILEDGFRSKVTWFCSEPNHCARFWQIHNGPVTFYTVQVNTKAMLNDGLVIEDSDDHSPAFFGASTTSWVVTGRIEPVHITDLYEHTFATNKESAA